MNNDSRCCYSKTPVCRHDFIRSLPKVELHAHLNGSIPSNALVAMLAESGEVTDKPLVLRASELLATKSVSERMKHCFTVFDAVYRVMSRASRLQKALVTVLEEYYSENTALLELRTTPRAGIILDRAQDTVAAIGTEADYVELVLAGLDAYDVLQQERGGPFMHVSLLLAIGRRMTSEQAMNVVDLAVRCRRDGAQQPRRIVGIDFSGDCYSGEWATFEPALRHARESGLRISLHVGEKDDDAELGAMLASRPDRIGHLVFASEANRSVVRKAGLPLELCISSNLMTTNWTLADHHVSQWLEQNHEAPPLSLAQGVALPPLRHPVSICTDDRGVFDTSLGKELLLMLECVRPSARPAAATDDDDTWLASRFAEPITTVEAQLLVSVTAAAIENSFADEACKAACRARLAQFCEEHASQLIQGS